MKLNLRLPTLLPIRKSGSTVLWVSLTISLALLGLLALVPKKPMVVFDLVAEYLEQDVSRPELSAIALRDATVSASAGCEALLTEGRFTGVVQPGAGSRVSYAWRDNAIAIGINGPDQGTTTLIFEDEAECRLEAKSVSFALSDPAAGTRLPLAGAAEIGREFGVATVGADRRRDLLRRGSFEVYGRSIAPWATDVLYPITASAISIPAGTRLQVSGGPGTERPLFGIVTFTPEGFAISATADASQISLYRPGGGQQTERFAFGVFSDFLGDPQIGVIFFFFFLATTVFQLLTSWMGTWRSPDPEDAG